MSAAGDREEGAHARPYEPVPTASFVAAATSVRSWPLAFRSGA